MFSRLTDRLEVDMESLLSSSSLITPNNIHGDSGEQDEEHEVLSFLPSLSWQERLGGCLACMTLGYILSLGSFFRFRDLLKGDPSRFVIYTTVGNIISLSGSCFLSGPKSQMQKMFHQSRKVATVWYLGSLAVTLVFALCFKDSSFHPQARAAVLLILVGIQYVAVFWYCLSYIPFARQMGMRFMERWINSYG
jgi:Membrane protein involved in ER to Golgi transport